MKILMITSFYEPHIGGVEKHVRRVSHELIKKGHQISVLTRRYDPKLAIFEASDGLFIHRFPPTSLAGIWRWLSINRRIVADSDVVHCHDFGAFFYYAPFRIIYPRKRVYITFHGHEGILPIPLSIRYRRRIAEVLTTANICVGHYITKWYGTKADEVTYGGIDPPTESSSEIGTGVMERPIDAVFVGRLEPDTGIMRYLQALQILKDKSKIEIELHICGDGRLHDTIVDFADEHDLKVTLHGFTDPKSFLRQSRFAFVSGYLAILEAMMERCLVFSVYDNPLKEDYLRLIPASEHMVISSDPADLANNIAYYLQNQPLALDKIRGGYGYASEQSWTAVANKYLQLWRR